MYHIWNTDEELELGTESQGMGANPAIGKGRLAVIAANSLHRERIFNLRCIVQTRPKSSGLRQSFFAYFAIQQHV
jgi:hypothetical protein